MTAVPSVGVRLDGSTYASWGPKSGKPAQPYEPGNTEARKHGGRAVVSLRQRQLEIAQQLAAIVPGYAASDEPAVLDLALAMAREESMLRAHEQVSAKAGGSDLALYVGSIGEVLRPLHDAIDKNLTRKAHLYAQLAMTPRSRIDLGLTAVRAAAVVREHDDVNLDSLTPEGRALVFRAMDALDGALQEARALAAPVDAPERPAVGTEPEPEAETS